MSGTKLGRYEIRSQIGAGGMGEVYRARDLELGRDGQRFLVNTLLEQNERSPVTVVMNWTADLKK